MTVGATHPRRASGATLALFALVVSACGGGDAEPVADDAAGAATDDHAGEHAHAHAADGHEDVAPDIDAVIVPDFELANIDGSTSRLSDYRGHPVAVVFMHTY